MKDFYVTAGDCHDILIIKSIAIVDQNNTLLEDVDLTIINTRTDRELCVDENGIADEFCRQNMEPIETTPAGIYFLVTSSNIDRNGSGARHVQHHDILKAIAEKDGSSVTAKYIVELSDGRCHPEKIHGPDPLVLELPGN